MEVCDDRHTPKYQVKYHSARGSNYNPVWLVCELCMEDKPHFNDKGQIKSIEVLTWKLVKQFSLKKIIDILNLKKFYHA